MISSFCESTKIISKFALEYKNLVFKSKLNFLNSSRQTRLLGRWVKLAKEKNDNSYKNYIKVTQNRLKKSLSLLGDKNLDFFYNKYIFKI